MFAGEMLDPGIEVGKDAVEVQKNLKFGWMGHGYWKQAMGCISLGNDDIVTTVHGGMTSTIITILPIDRRSTSSVRQRNSSSIRNHVILIRNIMRLLASLLLLFGTLAPAFAEQIGEVDTVFKFIGPNHKIVVDVFDDPKVAGVSCYMSRARTGGIKGAIGVAEDKSEASVACRQVGEIRFNGKVPRQEEVFSERASILFKRVRVVRMADPKRNTLIYLVYSDRVIEGSPQNSVTAVPVPANLPVPVE